MKEKQKNEIHGNRKQQKLVGVQLRDGGGPGDLKSHSGVHLIWNSSQETDSQYWKIMPMEWKLKLFSVIENAKLSAKDLINNLA